MKWFSRDLSTVETRATEARLAIEALQTRQAEAALDAVLSGNYSECDQIAVQLRTANEKLKVLQLAEQAVRDKETEAERGAKQREVQARRRAQVQHLSRLTKASADFEAAVSQMVASWKGMLSAAQAAQAQSDRPIPELTDRSLFNLAEKELARQGRTPDHLGSRQWAPGSGAAALGGQSFHEIESLSKALARISKWTTERFAVTSQVKAKTAPAAEAPMPLVAAEGPKDRMTPYHATQPQPQAAPEGFAGELPRPPASEVVADQAQARAFRKLEAMKNPHAEGTEEHSGFTAALAEMQSKARNQGDRE